MEDTFYAFEVCGCLILCKLGRLVEAAPCSQVHNLGAGPPLLKSESTGNIKSRTSQMIMSSQGLKYLRHSFDSDVSVPVRAVVK